jgi:heme/copper-type cytochrome/quinol oxidase subunit 4
LLNVITYKEKPDNPDSKNHLKSFLLGIFILSIIATIININVATKYLKKPSENAEKYLIVILVKIYANDQKIIVIIAKR